MCRGWDPNLWRLVLSDQTVSHYPRRCNNRSEMLPLTTTWTVCVVPHRTYRALDVEHVDASKERLFVDSSCRNGCRRTSSSHVQSAHGGYGCLSGTSHQISLRSLAPRTPRVLQLSSRQDRRDTALVKKTEPEREEAPWSLQTRGPSPAWARTSQFLVL
jgi:hypothetical protein